MPDEMDEHSDAVLSENEDGSETFSKDNDKMSGMGHADGNGEVKKKYDPKDPSRPRRKKARRACYACQRAHLTCGDERPCQRCIKRGLGDACQDGVRKKAKYLHDAPPEALRPVLGPNFNPNGPPSATRSSQRPNSGHSDHTMSTSNSNFFSGGTGSTATFPMYQGGGQTVGMGSEGLNFGAQRTAASSFPQNGAANGNGQQMDSMLSANPMDFNALFDPSNPALYNFDLEGLNFGSQYAGWEFGILNKMGLGAETPPRENSMSQTPTNDYAAVFGNGTNSTYDSNSIMSNDFSGMEQNQSMYNQGNLQHGLPHAYAIAAGPTSMASPSTEATASPQNPAMADGSPGNFGSNIPVVSTAPRIKSKQLKVNQTILGKRQRDSASIYESVKEPYPYTKGFHNMVSVLRKRLPLNKLLRIAQALGEIRPSFIASTKDLTREDLVFMEKCFQRTLVEFNDFLQQCCAPTIVCRRSGEVAAVNKEFTALTGWTKDVLLGKEPNKHVHIRQSNGAAQEGDGLPRSEATTPRLKDATIEGNAGRPQPVFLGELMDDDSIVEFYKDYSQLAFEDSRGKVQRSCRLVKYRTQRDLENLKAPSAQKDPRTGMLSNRVTTIDGEHGISMIEQDGKVSCTYCWTIKRDVFDIPMMIIINFLPRYYPNQEPHQLAV
ncbi:Transcriptional regulator of nonfermentable carbon utilization [Amphichorda felina]